MDEFIRVIGIALVGLGGVGFVVCMVRMVGWYRRQGGKTGSASRGGE